ncbi:hypothetical protein [Oceanobacillus sp. FSL W7-1304]|uniref:hypothetical protein n=1 Tax=Oceanobacillus sp. FSL W7-1304 TaxID=2975322 RepID=UPI0030D7EC2E
MKRKKIIKKNKKFANAEQLYNMYDILAVANTLFYTLKRGILNGYRSYVYGNE